MKKLNCITHEVFGEGYYFLDKDSKLTIVPKKFLKFAKKLIKRGYEELTDEQLRLHMVDYFKKFESRLAETVVLHDNGDYTSNILYLWYKDGFCHYKTFEKGKIDGKTVSYVNVNTCNEKIDNYPRLEKVYDSAFGIDFDKKIIYDDELIALYKMYGDMDADN